MAYRSRRSYRPANMYRVAKQVASKVSRAISRKEYFKGKKMKKMLLWVALPVLVLLGLFFFVPSVKTWITGIWQKNRAGASDGG